MNIRCIIVDDEELAQTGLKYLLNKCEDPYIEVLATCGDAHSAVELINKYCPEVIFLDINMPHINGFELINLIPKDKLPFIIFVTAYAEFALKGFDSNAVDYLLKPVDFDRLKESLMRLKSRLKIQHIEKNQSITIKDSLRKIKILCNDIISIEAAGNYMCINTKNETCIHRSTMKSIQAQLNSTQFIKIHRSIIVNKNQVQEIVSLGKSRYELILSNNVRLKSSTNYRNQIKKIKL